MEFLIIFFFIILFLLIFSILYLKKEPQTSWKATVELKLNELSYQANSHDVHIRRSVIIELDKLLDFTIKQYGLSGESMGDRLKQAHSYFDKNLYNEIWSAHKIRNKLAHEIDYSPSQKILDEAVITFRKAIKKLL